MAKQRMRHGHWLVAALALLIVASQLAWQHAHGGVPRHHLFDRADLPAISNWWGIAILPLLGWFAARSAIARMRAPPGSASKIVLAFSGAFLLGLALSFAFAAGYESVSSFLFFGAILSGLVLRLWRGEYVFGFVLGMMFVFGSVLPALAACFAATISLAFHRLAWPACAWAFNRIAARQAAGKPLES